MLPLDLLLGPKVGECNSLIELSTHPGMTAQQHQNPRSVSADNDRPDDDHKEASLPDIILEILHNKQLMIGVEEGPGTKAPPVWAYSWSQNASTGQHMICIPS